MKRTTLLLSVVLLGASAALVAQSSRYDSNLMAAESMGGGGGQAAPSVGSLPEDAATPFSQMAFGGGISAMGIQLQLAANLRNHLNLRGVGNFFDYSTNFTTNGITANAKLSLASAGVAVDYYPFRLGFRVSPGLLFYNGNQLTASASVPGGTSFTLNDTTYYSANTNPATGATPINGSALLALNTTKPAFTITTGWGNMIPRKGHLSFPFEIGVAVTGSPRINVNLGGWACSDQAQQDCGSIASNSNNSLATQVQSNLSTQVAKWTNDLNPLTVYPILSVGVAYSFKVR